MRRSDCGARVGLSRRKSRRARGTLGEATGIARGGRSAAAPVLQTLGIVLRRRSVGPLFRFDAPESPAALMSCEARLAEGDAGGGSLRSNEGARSNPTRTSLRRRPGEARTRAGALNHGSCPTVSLGSIFTNRDLERRHF